MIKLKELLLKELAVVTGINDESIDLGFDDYPGTTETRTIQGALWTKLVLDPNGGVYAKAIDKMGQPFYFRFFHVGVKDPELISHPPANAAVLPDDWVSHTNPHSNGMIKPTMPDNWKVYNKS